MKEIDLKSIITQYPESLDNPKMLKGIICDLYPQCPRGLVNAVMAVAESHVFIPNSVTSIGYCVFDGCKQLKRITVQEGNTRYYSKGNCLIDKEHESSFKSAKNAKEFHALKEKQTIDGVRSVGKSKETDNSDTVSVCKKNEGTRNSPKSKNERKAKQPGRFIYIASDNGPFVEYKLVQLDNDASKKR